MTARSWWRKTAPAKATATHAASRATNFIFWQALLLPLIFISSPGTASTAKPARESQPRRKRGAVWVTSSHSQARNCVHAPFILHTSLWCSYITAPGLESRQLNGAFMNRGKKYINKRKTRSYKLISPAISLILFSFFFFCISLIQSTPRYHHKYCRHLYLPLGHRTND